MTDDITGPDEPETGGRLTIDLSAIQTNYRLLQERAGRAECAAVVKADAYGLGAARVAKALWDAGARTFFVAHPFEARTVRTAAPDAVIYVLSGLPRGAAPGLRDIDARPVLGSLPEIDEWAAFARSNAIRGHAAIHVDTGMNRLGVTSAEAAGLAERHTTRTLGFEPSLLMSHLACADEPQHPLNARQYEAFKSALGCGGAEGAAPRAGRTMGRDCGMGTADAGAAAVVAAGTGSGAGDEAGPERGTALVSIRSSESSMTGTSSGRRSTGRAASVRALTV